MSKINIRFNNKNYSIDESAFAAASAELKDHLSTVINGSGATINFDGVAYSIDPAKLSTAKNDFISHIETIAAVVEDYANYPAAGLYETGSNYTVMTKSWDALLSEGTVHVDDGVVTTYFDTDAWENNSSDILAGDLVLPNDESIVTIGDCAFTLCENLTSIIIPNSVTTIGYSAFEDCSSSTSIIIPNSVTAIGNSAFFNCFKLTSIMIPDSVTAIDVCTFYNCLDLTSIIIPSSVTTIGDEVFENCKSLTLITFNGTIEQWNNIEKGKEWNYEVPATEAVCSDGTVAL